MLAMNVVTVKEKTARGGKRKWNCVSIYGMIGIDVRCATHSEDRLNCVRDTEHKTAP